MDGGEGNGMGEGEEERGSREEEDPLLPIPRYMVQGAYSLFLPVLLYVCYWQRLDPSRFGNSPEAGTSLCTGLAGMGTGYSSCKVGGIFWSRGWILISHLV